jgi:hypothetical protein
MQRPRINVNFIKPTAVVLLLKLGKNEVYFQKKAAEQMFSHSPVPSYKIAFRWKSTRFAGKRLKRHEMLRYLPFFTIQLCFFS